MNAAIDHRDQRVEHVLRHAGAAGRHAGNPRHQHRAHGCAIVGGADADRTCKDCAPLVLGQICCAEPLPGVGAECGVDAVQRLIAIGQAQHDVARRRDTREHRRRQRDLRAPARDGDDVGDRRGDFAADADRRQRTMPLAFRKSWATSRGSIFSPSTL